MKAVVGLIGGIGSGKSTVARLFVEKGAFLIEGDQLGHEGLRQPEIRRQIVATWGPKVCADDGHVDRKKLGAIVFANDQERRILEGFVFPYIERRIREEIEAARRDPQCPLIVLDAAVMLEAGWDRYCDWIVFVDAPREQRLQRLEARRGWSGQELDARERAQRSLEEKRNRADAVIDNSAGLQETKRQVERLWEKLRSPKPRFDG